MWNYLQEQGLILPENILLFVLFLIKGPIFAALKIRDMLERIKKNYLKIIFTLVGGIGGLLYWKFVGCLSGTCPIKSIWYLSTLYGLAIGYLAGDIIISFLKRKNKETEKS